MNTFKLAMSWVIRTEGGYVNHPSDPGGETKYGISKRQYPTLDIATLTVEEAQEIYRVDYWDDYRCGELPPAIALFTFDCLVNHRPTTAGRLLQLSLRQPADGVIGPNTIAAANTSDPHTTCRLMALERLDLYDNLVRANSKNAAFIDGWRARVLDLYEYLITHLLEDNRNEI